MKRIGNIYPKICDKNNMKMAIMCASKGKTNRKNVKKIIDNIDYYVDKTYDLLINKNFQASPYEKKEIIDGVKIKRELFISLDFSGQVVHWCLMLQIENILRKPMYYYSCARILYD